MPSQPNTIDQAFQLSISEDDSQNNWANIELPNTWVDSLLSSNLWLKLKLLASFPLAHKKRVALPQGVPGADRIPAYVLQPFHNLPNGNYSKKISRGYITGFDKIMLGEPDVQRKKLASHFEGLDSVLDAGCAGGKLAEALTKVGVKNVWGLDPSPYLLQHAAQAYPEVNFVQGVIEDMQFQNASLDGIAACFLFHEIPPKFIKQGLKEIHRVLKTGGVLAFCEPSRLQYERSFSEMFRDYGWRGVYFKILAIRVHEPFVQAWHKQDLSELLREAGFDVLMREEGMPASCFVARKQPV